MFIIVVELLFVIFNFFYCLVAGQKIKAYLFLYFKNIFLKN